MKQLTELYLSKRDKLPKLLMLKLLMTMVGNQMKISLSNFMILKTQKNFKERILNAELLLLMMTSQETSNLKKKRRSLLQLPRAQLKLLFKELKDQMVK